MAGFWSTVLPLIKLETPREFYDASKHGRMTLSLSLSGTVIEEKTAEISAWVAKVLRNRCQGLGRAI